MGGASLVLANDHASANDDVPRLELDYAAPAECPSRAAFEALVRARLPSNVPARMTDARRFEVHIERIDSGRYTGRLDVHGSAFEPNVREIGAASCAVVGTSLAVFLALALDPESEPVDSTKPEEPPPVVEPAAPPPATRRPVAPGARPVSPPAARWLWTSGLRATHLRAPDAAWGARIHTEIARDPRRGVIAPAMRISWGWTAFSVPAAHAGIADLQLQTARVEACARIRLPRAFAIAPCGAFDIGYFSGETPDLASSRRVTTPWLAAGGVVRGSWSPTPWIGIEIDAALLAPPERTSFVLVDPYRLVYEVPALLVDVGLGAGVVVRFE